MDELLKLIFETKYYEYNSKFYKPIGVVKLKCPESGQWSIGIRYKSATRLGLESGDIDFEVLDNTPEYVRDATEFLDKFKTVKDL